MKRFVEGVDRGQSTLLPECLDDFIDEINPVRAIDAFVDALDRKRFSAPTVLCPSRSRSSTIAFCRTTNSRARLTCSSASLRSAADQAIDDLPEMKFRERHSQVNCLERRKAPRRGDQREASVQRRAERSKGGLPRSTRIRDCAMVR
jgi:hypothetical protein